jgi:hypothetical protein
LSAGRRKDLDMLRTLFALASLAALLTGLAVRADADAVYRPAIVAYFDADDRFVAQHDVQGVVTYFSRFSMTLRADGREYPVVLHQGTVIRPTGTTLAPSMVVNVEGYWSEGAFYANRIVVVRY